MKSKKLLYGILKINIILSLFVMFVLFSISSIIYSFGFLTDSTFSRKKLTEFFKKQEFITQSASNSTDRKVGFLESDTRNIYINSKDGLRLHAVYKENAFNKNKIAIICHGYSGSAISAQRYAKGFYNLGYNVLCPDARAHGESQGNVIGMGYLEKYDILLWINLIVKNNKNAEIVLFGYSMGGACVLMASAEDDIPQNVKAVISDCAYTSAYDEVSYLIKNVTSLKKIDLTSFVSLISKIKGGYFLDDASALKAVKKSRIPTLFIHGENDNFVPFYMLDKLYYSAQCPKKKIVFKDAGHAQSESKNSKRYWQEAEQFLKQYIK